MNLFNYLRLSFHLLKRYENCNKCDRSLEYVGLMEFRKIESENKRDEFSCNLTKTRDKASVKYHRKENKTAIRICYINIFGQS